MLLKRSPDLRYSDVTPRQVYLDRRKFLYGMGLAGGLALAGKSFANLAFPSSRAYASTKLAGVVKGPFSTDEKVTPKDSVTTYNNYYEFGTEKDGPSRNAGKFVTSPWSVSVEGEVAKPRKFTSALRGFRNLFRQEANASVGARRNSVAVCGRFEAGRSDAPAGAAVRRDVR